MPIFRLPVMPHLIGQPPRQEPLYLLFAPQGELRRTVLGLEPLEQLDRPKALLIGLKGHGELGQRHIGIFQRERLPVEPDHRLTFRQALLAVKLPLAETEIAQLVQPARKAPREEDAVQMFWRPDVTQYLIEYLCWRALAIFTLPMRP